MPEKICMIYWCEGAGHAARSIPVAQELEDRGNEVELTGGGPGKMFTEINGYSEKELPVLKMTEKKRKRDLSKLGLAKEILTTEIPVAAKRFTSIYRWFKEEEPDKVITDDPFAVTAASIQGLEFYRIEHVIPDVLPFFTRISAKLYSKASMIRGEKIFFTSLWDVDYGENCVSVDPLAQEGEASVEEYDVLIIPGSWSEGFEDIKKELEDKGLDVRMVGDDDWELVPAMTPYTSAAKCVLCTGFSSIADSVVAGTPCVVYPFISFQENLTREIEKKDIQGIETVNSHDDAVDAIEFFVDNPEERPEYENGVEKLVDNVLG